MTTIFKKSLLFLAVVGSVSSASAKVYLNSMCYMSANSNSGTVSGEGDIHKMYNLASISKIVTSLWSLEVLGTEYRFTTKLHVDKIEEDLYDVHIEGGLDPVFGRSAGYFLASELNREGVDIKNIRNLTFDENFYVEWNLEEKAIIGGDSRFWSPANQPEVVMKSLRANFATAPSKSKYQELVRKANSLGISMQNAVPSLNVADIVYKEKNSYRKSATTTTLIYRSAALRTILKNMNNKSNNYIADQIYWNLGGTPAFAKYATEVWGLDNQDVSFTLGSGNNKDYLSNISEDYSKASCSAMVKIIARTDRLLENAGLDLTDIMAVAKSDTQSTLSNFSTEDFAGAVVAKTGSVNRAKTLAGSVSTKDGEFYFTILVNTDKRSEWGAAQSLIKSKLTDFIRDRDGAKRISYEQLLPLPFDSKSRLVNETSLLGGPRG